MSDAATEDVEPEPDSVDVLSYEEAMQNGHEAAVVNMPQPDLADPTFGAPQRYWRIRRAHKKRRKLSKKGYVRWFLIDETFPEAKFVKPELTGTGVPEVRHDGVPYAFPREAMLADERTGMYTVVHKKGDAEPLNLRDPEKKPLPTDRVEEWLHLQLHKEPPSWLDDLLGGLSGRDIFLAMLGLVILLAVVYPMLSP
jgi:hypothetical protein